MEFRVVPIVLGPSGPPFYYMGSVLTASIVAASLTYIGVREVE